MLFFRGVLFAYKLGIRYHKNQNVNYLYVLACLYFKFYKIMISVMPVKRGFSKINHFVKKRLNTQNQALIGSQSVIILAKPLICQ